MLHSSHSPLSVQVCCCHADRVSVTLLSPPKLRSGPLSSSYDFCWARLLTCICHDAGLPSGGMPSLTRPPKLAMPKIKVLGWSLSVQADEQAPVHRSHNIQCACMPSNTCPERGGLPCTALSHGKRLLVAIDTEILRGRRALCTIAPAPNNDHMHMDAQCACCGMHCCNDRLTGIGALRWQRVACLSVIRHHAIATCAQRAEQVDVALVAEELAHGHTH